jgi:MoaA/NifB/PqqE/SkfB family radical SAM enzyme
MCPRNQTTVSNSELTLDMFKRALSAFNHINTVILLGRGETFMMSDIFRILDYGSSRGVHFTIVTNGTMLTPDVVRRLPVTGKMVVSIDHPVPEEYAKIRKGAHLERVIKNLKSFKSLRPQQWLCIQGIVMTGNLGYLEGFVRLAKETGADSVKLIHPVIFEKHMGGMHIEPTEYTRIQLNRAAKLAKKEGVRFVAVPGLTKPRLCMEPWTSLRVSLKGDIYPCCYINNSNGSSWQEWCGDVCVTVPQSSYVMGNINDGSVEKIWNGDAFRSLRSKVINTMSREILSMNRLNERRSLINVSDKYCYCSVCLYRQNMSC